MTVLLQEEDGCYVILITTSILSYGCGCADHLLAVFNSFLNTFIRLDKSLSTSNFW